MYVVIEIQKNHGKIITHTNAYDVKNQAENKFYSILAEAATSDVEVHSAVILTEEGYIDKCQSYKHSEEDVQEKGIK
ncbi:MAG: hypothetical protein IJA72_04765 [Clostridia bacterium]|nr:hypothetical protein [Clostridia bacterium]